MDPPSAQFDHEEEAFRQLFVQDISPMTIWQYGQFYLDFLKSIPVPTSVYDPKHDELLDRLNLKSQMYALISEGYKVAKRDTVQFKVLGVRIMT